MLKHAYIQRDKGWQIIFGKHYVFDHPPGIAFGIVKPFKKPIEGQESQFDGFILLITMPSIKFY